MIDVYFYITMIVMIAIIVYYVGNKKFWDPFFLFSLPLNLQYIVYYLIYRHSYIISDTTIGLFFLGQLCFFIGYISFNMLPKKNKKSKGNDDINFNLVLISLIIGIFCFFLSLNYIMKLDTSNFNFNSVGANIREAFIYSASASPFYLTYGKYFLLFSISIIWYLYLSKKIVIKKYVMFLLLLLLFSNSFIVMSRTDLLITILPIVVIYYVCLKKENNHIHEKKKLNFTSYVFIAMLIFLFYLMNSQRQISDTLSNELKDNIMIQYIGRPIVAFDIWIVKQGGMASGFLFFEAIGKVLNVFGIEFQNNVILAPLGQFNVYSYLRVPYIEYGILGIIIIMFLIGNLSNFLYFKFKSGRMNWVVFYSFYSYALVMAFFDWQFGIITYVYLTLFLIIVSFKLRS